jgi:hypothetical protein
MTYDANGNMISDSSEPIYTAIGCTAYFYITDHLMAPQMVTSIFGTAE